MFICPSCHKETPRLIAFSEGIKCSSCAVTSIRVGNPEAHVKYGGKLTGKARENMTVADVKHIWNRTLSPDGKSVTYKDRRWR